MPIEVVVIPPDQALPRWWEFSPVCVRWQVEREPNSAVLTARGSIMVEPRVAGDDAKDDAEPVEAGEIVVAKAAMGDSDVALQMDALSGDHELLAGQICGERLYEPTFFEWFDTTFGVILAGDPVFILDLKIDPRYQDEDGVVAAHTVLEALAAFGSAHSPIVTFHEDSVGESVRTKCKAEGLWSWIVPLRAERWKGVYVACRPQD